MAMSNKRNDGTKANKELFVWTTQLDEAFIQAMRKEQDNGNRFDGTFTSQAYTNMVEELIAALSGFSWNPITKLLEAEDDAKLDAEKWRTKPINHHNEMLDFFGKDRATCDAARTAKERRNQMNINEERIDKIDEIDQLSETNVVSLENFDTNESFQATPHSQVNLSTITKIKSRKRKVEEDDAFMSKIVCSLNNIVDAIDRSSKVMENSRPHVYLDGEIYKELQLIGVSRTTTVTKILKVVTKVPAQEEHKLLLRYTITKEHPHAGHKYYQKVKVVQEVTGSHGHKSRDQALRMMIHPSHGYDDLKEAFQVNFRQQKKCIKYHVEIHHIKQREGESTKDFVRRFKVERRDVKWAPKIMRILGFMHGITNPELIKRLHDKILKSVAETMRITTSFLRGEVAAGNQERKKSLPPWKQQEAGHKQNFKKGGFKNQQRSERRHDRFTILLKSPKESMALEKGKFKTLPPMTTLIKKTAINFVSFMESRKDQPKANKKGETFSKDKALEILMAPSRNKKLDESGYCPFNRVQWRNHTTIRAIITTGEDWRRKTFNLSLDEFCDTGGILTLKSNKIIPIECTIVLGPKGQPPASHQAIEERIKVAINPDYLEQTIMIGSTLTKEGRNKLCDLLQRNLDVFAWKPADMTSVPRHIVEHRLNIREGCPPVRQKRRGQAANRNQAIQEEVEKLVDACIMKEVHYHSWLSNPVMVKKHDGSWRMCVDFKDLNKACPKDGYPLPKIDWKVESLCGFPFKFFLDAYKGYHWHVLNYTYLLPIKMSLNDQKRT
ncbi:reverse transcriptase domain-containing protein [Tanacetum coccineum]